MNAMIFKMISFISIIIIGYAIKRAGVVKESDGVMLSHIVMKVTLPAFLITATNGITLSWGLVPYIFLGLAGPFVVNGVAYLINRKEPGNIRAISMINASGYNNGLFLMPIVSGIFPTWAIMYLIFFDIGNSLMVFGGNNALALAQINKSGGSLIRQIMGHCVRSIPFMTYFFMIALGLLGIVLPTRVIDIATIPAAANSFLCMALIGIKLNFTLDKAALKSVFKTLVAKYAGNLAILALFMVLPIESTAKLIIALALVTPTPVIAVIYSIAIDAKSKVPPIVATLSTLISLILMMGLLVIFG